jgi:membrane protein implicated in regulation of membrane protease activity
MEWLDDHGWIAWLAIAAVLGTVEVATLDLLFAMLAAGAVGGAVAVAVGVPFLPSVFIALAVAAAMLVVVRPVALRHLKGTTPSTRTGVAALVGREALVLERVDAHTGRISLGGEVWSARSYDPSLVLEPGCTADVVAIEGATAVVYGTGSS